MQDAGCGSAVHMRTLVQATAGDLSTCYAGVHIFPCREMNLVDHDERLTREMINEQLLLSRYQISPIFAFLLRYKCRFLGLRRGRGCLDPVLVSLLFCFALLLARVCFEGLLFNVESSRRCAYMTNVSRVLEDCRWRRDFYHLAAAPDLAECPASQRTEHARQEGFMLLP